jgi:tRNA(Arg) A34 adenosine deaminase TadA
MVLSNTDMRYITQASTEAGKSDVLMRHGSVAVSGGKIMGRGHNHYRSHSKDAFITNTCTCHAEIASLRNMFHQCSSNSRGKHNNSIKGGQEQ